MKRKLALVEEEGPILQNGQEWRWTIVDQRLVTWAKASTTNRRTFYEKYRDHGRGDFVPCENKDCQKLLGIGERALTVNWKIPQRGRTQKQVFCSVKCQRENLESPTPRLKPVMSSL